jgi:hypothetical protein
MSGSERSPLFLLSEAEIRRAEQACRKALRISNDESELMSQSMRLMSMLADNPPTVPMMKRFLASEHAAAARLMIDGLGRSWHPLAPRARWLQEQFDALFAAGDIAPPPLVTGDDLTTAGLQPGRLFKRILD